LVLGAGLFDAGANALFLAAARTGLLSLVAVLSALYPASTILLARVVLGERIGPMQRLGLVTGLVGVILIAAA
jgi:drug/metabolite transporter (DMT)-like permease